MILALMILLTAFFVGGGWSLCFLGQNPNWENLFAHSFLTGAAICVLCWSWLFGLGGTVNHVQIGIVSIALLGWLITFCKQRMLVKNISSLCPAKESKRDFGFAFLIFLIILFVGLFPKMVSPFHATMAVRTGPDAIGSSIAVDALLNDGSKHQIQQLLLSEVPEINTLEEFFNSSELVYTFSSFSKQVKGEFIVLGLRLGLSGISASILNFIGDENLWAVLAVLPTLAVLCGAFVVFRCLRSNYVTSPIAFAAAACGAANVNLLHGWHEGGLAQAFVFLSTSTIFSGLFTKNFSKLQRFGLATISTIVGLVVYSDWFIVFFGLLLVNFFLNLKFRQFQFAFTRSGPVLLGYGIGFLLCGPYAISFIRYIPQRIGDASRGGWPMSVWSTPAEILGISHTYNTPVGVSGYQSGAIFVVLLSNLCLLVFLTRMVRTKFDQTSITFLFSVAIIVFSVFIKAKFIDSAHNYQYFKAIGLLAPLLFPLMGFSFNSKPLGRSNPLLFYVLVFGAFVSSINYTLNYRDSSLRMPSNSPAEVLASNSDGGLDRLNLVGKWDYESQNLAPFMDLNLIDRSRLIRFRRTTPLGLLINIRDCPRWFCLENVESSNLVTVNSQFKILILSETSAAVSSSDGMLLSNYLDVVNELSKDLGGPSL